MSEDRVAQLLSARLVPIVQRHFTGWALRSRYQRDDPWEEVARDVLRAVDDARAVERRAPAREEATSGR